jgi:hypothetical protein
MKYLISLLASLFSLLGTANKSNIAPPLNTAIISYYETYYAPAVAEPGNFPKAKTVKIENGSSEKTVSTPATPVVTTPPPVVAPTPPPAPVISAPPQDPYLAIPEPITPWLSMNLTLAGNSTDSDNPRVLPEISFDREYWRIEVFAYWAPNVVPPKPDMQNDYFKLEVYEKGTDKLIYTMTSGSNETIHKFQAFRKPGMYYFKVYTVNPSQWEMSFAASSKIAQ